MMNLTKYHDISTQLKKQNGKMRTSNQKLNMKEQFNYNPKKSLRTGNSCIQYTCL